MTSIGDRFRGMLSTMRSRRSKNTRRKPKTKTYAAAKQPRTWGSVALAIVKWGLIAGVAMAAIGAASIAMMFWMYGSDPELPSIRDVGDYDPIQVTRVRASDDEVVGEIFEQRRRFMTMDEIPEMVVEAFISAEDANFFEHEGIDYVGMVRAAIVNLRSGQTRQGASTITQQVVKTFLLTPERTFKRKVQEIILARRLENSLDKDEILTLYLNQIYFGHGRYGLREAAEYYFAKSPEELNVGEAAVLAGLPQAPNRISPKRPQNVRRAKSRQTYVLSRMAHRGIITEEEAQHWIDEPIRVVGDPYPALGEAPEWVEIVRRELVERYGEDALTRLGADVVTTLDRDVQRLAREALRAGLRDADERHRYGRPIRRVAEDRIELALARLGRDLPERGPQPRERYQGIVVEVHDDPEELLVDLGGYQASIVLGTPRDARYNPDELPPSERFGVGDLVHVAVPGERDDRGERAPTLSENELVLAPGPQGAVVVMDPHSREVLALAGGYELRIGDFNRATQAMRQPGSTFKPFVYAAALDTEEFTPASIVNDAPEVYDLWQPSNYEAGEFAGPLRLRVALARSINTVAIRVMYDIGPPAVAELARWMGIRSELPEHLSLALGSGEVTPLELTNAFATFAAGGKVGEPRFIQEVAGKREPPVELDEALRPEVAYLVTHMLRSVVTEGTAGRAARLPTHVVGKTGTSNDGRDNWFVGMSPSYVVGVWVGFDENLRIGRGATGGRNALPVFIEIMEELGKRERVASFERPPGVVDARIDEESGLLAYEGASDESSTIEVFLEGTAPTDRALAPDEVDAASFVLDQYADYGDGGGWGLGDYEDDDGDEADEDGGGGIFGGEGASGGGGGASPRP